MKKLSLLAIFGALLLSGCSSDGGPSTIGAHGKESVLSGTRLEGLYLMKFDSRNISINMHGGSGMELKL